jgi:hypothetical protein
MTERAPRRVDENSGAFGLWVDFQVDPPSEEEARNAALFTCENAKDVDDARDLMEYLGLVDVELEYIPKGSRKKRKPRESL